MFKKNIKIFLTKLQIIQSLAVSKTSRNSTTNKCFKKFEPRIFALNRDIENALTAGPSWKSNSPFSRKCYRTTNCSNCVKIIKKILIVSNLKTLIMNHIIYMKYVKDQLWLGKHFSETGFELQRLGMFVDKIDRLYF